MDSADLSYTNYVIGCLVGQWLKALYPFIQVLTRFVELRVYELTQDGFFIVVGFHLHCYSFERRNAKKFTFRSPTIILYTFTYFAFATFTMRSIERSVNSLHKECRITPTIVVIYN